MSAAQPLPTNNSNRPGRNRRGVIESPSRIPALAASMLGRSLAHRRGCVSYYRRRVCLVCLPGPRRSQRLAARIRPIRSEDLMAWWKRSTPADPAADPNLPLIRLEGITKIFKGDADEETRALDDVTVDIERGQYVSISGPSGCGKSTFLSMLALLDAPTAGRYTFNGRRVDRLSPAEKARVRNVEIGLIFQSFNLIGDMTVYENVEYPLTVRGVSGEERKARVD